MAWADRPHTRIRGVVLRASTPTPPVPTADRAARPIPRAEAANPQQKQRRRSNPAQASGATERKEAYRMRSPDWRHPRSARLRPIFDRGDKGWPVRWATKGDSRAAARTNRKAGRS